MIGLFLSSFFNWPAVPHPFQFPPVNRVAVNRRWNTVGARNCNIPVAAEIRTSACGSFNKLAKYPCKSDRPIAPIASAASDRCRGSLLLAAGTAMFHPSSDPSIPIPLAAASDTST